MESKSPLPQNFRIIGKFLLNIDHGIEADHHTLILAAVQYGVKEFDRRLLLEYQFVANTSASIDQQRAVAQQNQHDVRGQPDTLRNDHHDGLRQNTQKPNQSGWSSK